MWDAQMNAFCAWLDVICPDLAGFGDSAHLTAPESIAAHAVLVLELLDSLNILTFDLLGHSMGGGGAGNDATGARLHLQTDPVWDGSARRLTGPI
jgi:pimeloyl-ACP methyl ester carboxylesterase